MNEISSNDQLKAYGATLGLIINELEVSEEVRSGLVDLIEVLDLEQLQEVEVILTTMLTAQVTRDMNSDYQAAVAEVDRETINQLKSLSTES